MTSSLLKPSFRTNLPCIDHADGVFVYDVEGKDYLDGSSGPMAVSIGYGVPEVLVAMREQANKVCFSYRDQFTNRPAEELADALVGHAPEAMTHGFFVNSGSEATELAMRTALQYWQEQGKPEKTHVLGRKISYHGATLGSLSMSGHPIRRREYGNLLYDFAVGTAPYPFREGPLLSGDAYRDTLMEDWEAFFAEHGADDVAAIIVEPIVAAAGGVLVPPDGYLKALRETCDRHDVLLIADEVVTAIGRTGTWFACEHDGVTPDIIATAKGMSSGYTPMGSVLMHRRLVDALKAGTGQSVDGHTFSNNPLSAATCLAVIRYIEEHDVLANVRERATELESGLRRLADKYPFIADVRGRGLLWGVEVAPDRLAGGHDPASGGVNREIVADCFAAGLIVYPGGIPPENNAIILAPPLVIDSDEMQLLLERLDSGLAAFAERLRA